MGKFQNIVQLRARKCLSIQKQYVYYLIFQLLFISYSYMVFLGHIYKKSYKLPARVYQSLKHWNLSCSINLTLVYKALSFPATMLNSLRKTWLFSLSIRASFLLFCNTGSFASLPLIISSGSTLLVLVPEDYSCSNKW